MIAAFIYALIRSYSESLLYQTLVWFGLVGYVVHAIIFTLLTSLSLRLVATTMITIQLKSIAVAYVLAPVMFTLLSGFQSVVLGDASPRMMLYVWFAVIMVVVNRYSLCLWFSTISCNTIYTTLAIVDSLVAFVGFFMFRLLDLI